MAEIPERHKIQYECLVGGGFTTPSPQYAMRLIEELGTAQARIRELNEIRLKQGDHIDWTALRIMQLEQALLDVYCCLSIESARAIAQAALHATDKAVNNG